jgi:hypothetical protein
MSLVTRWLLAIAVALGSGGSGAGCTDAPTEAQCNDLLAHLIDLEFKNAGATDTSETLKAEIAKQKQQVATVKAAAFRDVCLNKTAKSRVECALAAKNLDAVGQCDEAK